jgi:hypothetical protein
MTLRFIYLLQSALVITYIVMNSIELLCQVPRTYMSVCFRRASVILRHNLSAINCTMRYAVAMRFVELLLAATVAVARPGVAPSSCTPLSLFDPLSDPFLTGLEKGWIPFADVPPPGCSKFEIVVGKFLDLIFQAQYPLWCQMLRFRR